MKKEFVILSRQKAKKVVRYSCSCLDCKGGRFRMEKYFLSTAETLIMKAIWDSKGREISICDLLLVLKEKYKKEYARTTVMTFLEKLSYKGFVKCRREGKYSYIEPLRDEEEYVAEVISNHINYWYNGSIAHAILALVERDKVRKKDLEQIVTILDKVVETKS